MRWEHDYKEWVGEKLWREVSGLFDITVPTFAWRGWRKLLARVASNPAKIRTRYLQELPLAAAILV
jgi:hypothetical protein